jgi:hypothetical protein
MKKSVKGLSVSVDILGLSNPLAISILSMGI